MSALDYNFAILKYVGIWRPREWSTGWKYRLYNIYTSFVILIVAVMATAELIDLLLTLNDIDHLAESMFMMLSLISVCGKSVTILISRDRIIKLLDILKTEICQAKNPDEDVAQEKFYRRIRFRVKAYSLLVIVTVIVMTIGNMLLIVIDRILPIGFWTPFNMSRDSVYISVISEEFCGLSITAFVNMSYDTLVPGIMLYSCAQFCILKCRIRNVATIYMKLEQTNAEQEKVTRDEISNCVRHHLLINQFAEEVNSIFGSAISLQCICSLIIICMSIYKLGHIKGINTEFASTMVYSSAMLLQIFMLCFAGTELTHESQHFGNAIYDADWYMLSQSNKASMLLMMVRSLRPIIFTSASVIQLSLGFFVQLIKLSYTTYNFLQQMSV
uniref:Odorant receptor n=1 Tax=Meteorus pulchricornis TaxID=51522 RepID=A0A1S5VFS4_9HYME|nr:olfactory receptor 91 [Meteorus pulchricornis]